jgi:hypothetical protein
MLLCGYNALKTEADKLFETPAIQPNSILRNRRTIKSTLKLNCSEMLKTQ